MNEVQAAATLAAHTAGRCVTEWEAACLLSRSQTRTPTVPTAPDPAPAVPMAGAGAEDTVSDRELVA